jgi:hypothetical protein
MRCTSSSNALSDTDSNHVDQCQGLQTRAHSALQEGDVWEAHCQEFGAHWRKERAALVATTELTAACILQAFQLPELRPLSQSKGIDPGRKVVIKSAQLKLLVAQPMACHCISSVMIGVKPSSERPLSNVSRQSNGSLLG